MKFFRKISSILLVGVALLGLAGCGADFWDNSIAQTVESSVALPEQYSITYEVETAVGEVHTVSKIQDGDGNIYFRSGDEEHLFIKDGDLYALYEKDSAGEYVARGMQAAYNKTYVDSVSAEFLTYAERSKQQFMPGMEASGEEEVLSRNCLVYGVTVGAESTGVTYSFFVDKETGICMGWDESKRVSGQNLGADGEVFICTEFNTEDIAPLTELIHTKSAN